VNPLWNGTSRQLSHESFVLYGHGEHETAVGGLPREHSSSSPRPASVFTALEGDGDSGARIDNHVLLLCAIRAPSSSIAVQLVVVACLATTASGMRQGRRIWNSVMTAEARLDESRSVEEGYLEQRRRAVPGSFVWPSSDSWRRHASRNGQRDEVAQLEPRLSLGLARCRPRGALRQRYWYFATARDARGRQVPVPPPCSGAKHDPRVLPSYDDEQIQQEDKREYSWRLSNPYRAFLREHSLLVG